jgi:hypothetical protein
MILGLEIFSNRLSSGSNLILSLFKHASLKEIREPSLGRAMKKISIFQRFNKVESLNIGMERDKNIDELDPAYIVGFVDGEGTFNVVKYPEGRIRPQFLVFNTDRNILEKIKETLQLNCPIFEVTRVNDFIKRRKKCYRLQARSLEDIKKVIAFFNENQPIVKKEDFKLFKNTYGAWILKSNSKL